jgi:hypothetical protein
MMRQLAQLVDDQEAQLAGAGLEPIDARCLTAYDNYLRAVV